MMHTVHLADSIAQKGGQVFGWLNGRVFVDSAIFCSSNYFGVYVELVLVFVLLYILFHHFDVGMFSIVLLFSNIYFSSARVGSHMFSFKIVFVSSRKRLERDTFSGLERLAALSWYLE